MGDIGRSNGYIVAFFSVEDFAQDVIAVDDLVRVAVVSRLFSDDGAGEAVKQWFIVITARLPDGCLAMASVQVGEASLTVAPYEPYHHDNAAAAYDVIRRYLESEGFATAPGVLNPKEVMENIVGGRAESLWEFDGTMLVVKWKEG